MATDGMLVYTARSVGSCVVGRTACFTTLYIRRCMGWHIFGLYNVLCVAPQRYLQGRLGSGPIAQAITQGAIMPLVRQRFWQGCAMLIQADGLGALGRADNHRLPAMNSHGHGHGG